MSSLEVVQPVTGAPVWVAPFDATVHVARVTLLHGMCSDPRRTCEAFLPLVGPRAHLACPTGNGACGAAADWRGDGEEKAAHLDAAWGAVWAERDAPAEAREVLVGFSRGAFVARDVAYARPGRYRALVLLGAAMSPDAARLRESGIDRVVLASGDYDPARMAMQRAARALEAGGLPARFVSLGPIGHALPRDLQARLGRALDWAIGG